MPARPALFRLAAAPAGPRAVTVPGDLAAALDGNPAAKAFFDQLSHSRQNAYVTWIAQAKQPATRARRIEQTVALLADHRLQR